MPTIYWTEFDWQSFSTLVAGALAVGAALVVGLRQVSILGRQTKLAEVTLRLALFDRRYAVYAATRDLLAAIVQTGERPDRKLEQQFTRMMGESRFLFRPSVHDDLRDLWKRVCGFSVLRAEMASTYQRAGHYGEGNPEKDAEMLSALSTQLNELPVLFGHEMQLGDG